MRQDHVHVLVLVFALTLLVPLSAARGQAPVNSFELRPGVVVSLDKNEAYVMKPEGGIAAVGLAQGNELWRSPEAAKPLTVSGDLLVSQAEPKAGESTLRIVTLDTSAGGRPEVQQDVELPKGVNAMIGESLNRSFKAVARVVTGEAAVVWEYAERPQRGARLGQEVLPDESAPVPGRDEPGGRRAVKETKEERRKMRVTTGSFRLDLKSGEVSGKRLGASGAEQRALRAAQAAAPASVPGVPEPQFRSADGKHVMHPERDRRRHGLGQICVDHLRRSERRAPRRGQVPCPLRAVLRDRHVARHGERARASPNRARRGSRAAPDQGVRFDHGRIGLDPTDPRYRQPAAPAAIVASDLMPL